MKFVLGIGEGMHRPQEGWKCSNDKEMIDDAFEGIQLTGWEMNHTG